MQGQAKFTSCSVLRRLKKKKMSNVTGVPGTYKLPQSLSFPFPILYMWVERVICPQSSNRQLNDEHFERKLRLPLYNPF